MIFSIFLLAILSISAVSAADNSTADVVNIDDSKFSIENMQEYSLDEEILANETIDDVLTYENEQNEDFQSSQKDDTFNNLDYLISCSESLAILDRDFIFNKTYDANYINGIGIHRDDLVIDGMGHIIDANNLARMFNVSGKNITFKNINFVNGYSAGDGGIIYCNGRNLTIINCTFSNGNAVVEGGALFAKSDNAKIISSKFFNNNAVYNAAVYMNGINSTVIGSYFEHNVANVSAGAIGWAKKDNGVIMDSIFVNNSALNEGGGAIFWNKGLNGKILNCTFENNYAIFNGSALFLNSDDTLVSDSIFINNNASDLGGAIFIKRQTAYIKNSKFINNSADVGGAIGAFYNLEIDNCTFIDNRARQQNDDVAIFVRISSVVVKNVTYGDTVNIVVNVTRQNGNVSIIINDKIYSAAISNGTATINIPDLDAGNYSATLTYYGDVNCTNPKKDVQVEVIPQTPTITAKTTSFVINYGGKYSVVLRDKKGNGLSGQKIKFILGSRYIGSVNTDKKGVATIELTSKNFKTAKAGNRALVMELVSKNYKEIDKSVNIKINKEKTKITVKKATFKMAKKVKKYNVSLKNSKNKAIKKASITLKVKGKIYKARTNSKGKATFKITKLVKKGKFTATIKYAGSKYYNAKTVKAKIIVK